MQKHATAHLLVIANAKRNANVTATKRQKRVIVKKKIVAVTESVHAKKL